MNLYPLIPLFAWIVTIVVWSFVFGQRQWGPVTRAFLLFTGTCALWLTLDLLFYVPAFEGAEDHILRAVIPLWVSIGALFMNFAYRLVGRKPDGLYWLLVAATVAGAAFDLGTNQVLLGHVRHPWGVADARDPLLHALLAGVSAVAGFWGLWLVFRERGRTRGTMPRRHLGLVFYGGFWTIGLVLLLNVVLPDFLGVLDSPRFGSSAMALFVLVIFRAVTRHRFLLIGVEQVAGELFEDAEDGIALLTRRGRVLRINRAGRELLGTGSREEDDIALPAVLPGYTAEAFEQREFEVASETGKRIFAAAQTIPTGGGADRWLILTLRDITAERRAEEALRSSREELEGRIERRTAELRRSQQVETLGMLTGSAAHDFNNLLVAILGFAGAARDDLPPEHPLREDLDEVLAAAAHARVIVAQLLSFSRREKLDRRVLSLAAVVEGSLALIEASLPPTIEIRRELGATDALVDASQLHQVVVNLANNACDAMREAGGVLTLSIDSTALDEEAARSLRLGPTADGYVRFAVRDTGCGMLPAVRERIFEPFFTTREHEQRTGLGLVIVSRIVHEHGGAIRVESEPGRGTEVAVFLPRAAGGAPLATDPAVKAVPG
ncbi:MAG TPA: ATP-binding protein [Polyangia bacterium]|nr:ATP-binding protein [Polyangia bacterium]